MGQLLPWAQFSSFRILGTKIMGGLLRIAQVYFNVMIYTVFLLSIYLALLHSLSIISTYLAFSVGLSAVCFAKQDQITLCSNPYWL